jgi:hypothetical protein
MNDASTNVPSFDRPGAGASHYDDFLGPLFFEPYEGGFIFKEIRQRNPEWIDEIKMELEKELSEKFGAAPMIAPINAVISQAWK